MTAYKNFTLDFPERIQQLDVQFTAFAASRDLEVTYILMKLASAFLLPYERLDGKSGAKRHDVADPRMVRAPLELDKLFLRSSYCKSWHAWREYLVDDFSRGPVAWLEYEKDISPTTTSAVLLTTIRHAVAHSNVYFGGEGSNIEHIYFGNRREKNEKTDKYRVVRGSLQDVSQLIASWLTNVGRLRATNALVWQALDEAA